MKRFPDEIMEMLQDASRSFRKKSDRHYLKSQGLIYSAFSVAGFSVARELAQRDAESRIQQFSLPDTIWQGARVLDLGCNNGAMLFQASNLGIQCGLGIEYDQDKVELALKITNTAGLKNLEFQQGDIDQLLASDLEPYDIVFALAIERHVNDVEKLYLLLGKVTSKVLCFEGNGGCDIDVVKEKLIAVGFRDFSYKGFCQDDVVPSNNRRPVLLAFK
ncbi:class I SAM-dependent methyltransferase [Halomonas sp. MA07-2]|uniref:class I SAM-dependent methyltransferase n=1 Tax=Halomonas sp. MA07-2 TaxID=3440841 RepID=UPI003EEC60B9